MDKSAKYALYKHKDLRLIPSTHVKCQPGARGVLSQLGRGRRDRRIPAAPGPASQ